MLKVIILYLLIWWLTTDQVRGLHISDTIYRQPNLSLAFSPVGNFKFSTGIHLSLVIQHFGILLVRLRKPFETGSSLSTRMTYPATTSALISPTTSMLGHSSYSLWFMPCRFYYRSMYFPQHYLSKTPSDIKSAGDEPQDTTP